FLTGTAVRPGNNPVWYVSYQNVGTIAVASGNVIVTLPPQLTFISASPAANSVAGNVYTFDYQNLQPGENRLITITTETPLIPNITIGDSLTAFAEVNPIATDFTPANNRDTVGTIVLAGYDPNDKLVDQPTNISAGTRLTYTIRFQNTGNANAFNVEIRDTLDPDLDLNTLRIEAASHPFTASIRNFRALRFRFNNINLPPASQNEAASMGFVRFSIQVPTTAAIGTEFTNHASIYFDNNPPIVTNQTYNVIANLTTSINPESSILPVSIFPNPSWGSGTILNQSNNPVQFRLLNTAGQEVLRIESVPVGQRTIPIESLPQGLYFYEIISGDQRLSGKWLIQR
ncbi:MAG: T9SS type A sorting domain-containing protein, partial [Bacteroidia bacterium]|nr:T9SS type A sorting domain-containing protein [Bacteroidia bacterium]